MRCSDVEGRLGEHLTGALHVADRDAIDTHLAGCPSCVGAREELLGLERSLGAVRRRHERRYPSVIVVLLGITATILWVNDRLRVESPSGSTALQVALEEGSRMTPDPGARFEVNGPRDVTVASGRVRFDVVSGETPFLVHTPCGHVRVAGTTFDVEVEEKEMSSASLAVTAVVSVAVISGVVYFVAVDGDEKQIDPGESVRVSSHEPEEPDLPGERPRRSAPRVQPAEMAAAENRIAELEAQVKALMGKLDESQKTAADNAAKTEALRKKVDEVADVVAKAQEGGREPGALGIDGVVDLLDLESSREEALRRAYDEIVAEKQELEKRHAKVTRDGDKVTIDIPPFPEDGEALTKKWQSRLGSILTPAERDKYDQNGLERSLFRTPIGKGTGKIEIAPAGQGGTRMDTTWQTGGGTMKLADMVGPQGRDQLLAPWAHLLNQ